MLYSYGIRKGSLTTQAWIKKVYVNKLILSSFCTYKYRTISRKLGVRVGTKRDFVHLSKNNEIGWKNVSILERFPYAIASCGYLVI